MYMKESKLGLYIRLLHAKSRISFGDPSIWLDRSASRFVHSAKQISSRQASKLAA